MPTTPTFDHAARATDRPLSEPTHDNFQRADFAKRIAQTLVSRTNPDSIVVGLYGKWGEGKSTVLNFIRHSLKEASGEVAVFNFNPWRFPDESQLLVNFFGELAKTIDQQLYNTKEKAAKILTSYIAPLIPSFGAGPVTADVGKSVGELSSKLLPDVDKLRSRLEDLLVKSGKRVVVIIDDIDRLEKTQIQTVFRLVKLTADFKHTAYLLAFDDVMVARAMGEVFESGAEDVAGDRPLQAGLNFLEKIIQVPLRLPRARPDALLKFCFERVDEVLTNAGLTLPDAEAQRLGNALRSAILPRLTTPRLAVRYANSLSFSLPLVLGEVNTVDFILVEAMNVFYPDLYSFVATHEGHLTGSTRDSSRIIYPQQDHTAEEKAVLNIGLDHYKLADERKAAENMLRALFPRVAKLLDKGHMFFGNTSRLTPDELTRNQHIAASTHFGRYFAYTVLLGDVPDEEITAFLQLSGSEQSQSAPLLIARLDMGTFLQKISFRTPTLETDQAEAVWEMILSVSPKLNTARAGLFFSRSEATQASWLLLQVLSKLPAAERLNRVKQLVEHQGVFALAEELVDILGDHSQSVLKRLREGYPDEEDKLFTQAEWESIEVELSAALLRRALVEAGDQPLYKIYPEASCRLMHRVWQLAPNQQPLVDYVMPFLRSEPKEIYELLEACSPHVSVNQGPMFRASINADTVDMLARSLGPELHEIARQVLGPEAIEEYPGNERDSQPPTPENRLRQFIYLYEKRDATPSAEVVEED
ncbi:KAP family NTPase [Hymenobacter sp.]|jgi:hypothetical protein|uniref:KAP family P-loop NTPase fold protein n=1 Tax=Hymenobacter sp. TaxID=1898978 RepID=UPI002ED82D49